MGGVPPKVSERRPTSMLLTFPDLAPRDFEPWVDAGDASRKGMSTADFAAKTAET